MIAFALKDWKGMVITLIQFELAVITLTSVWITSVGRQLGHGALTMIHAMKLWESSAQIFFMIAHVMPREYFTSRSSHRTAIMNVKISIIAKFTRHAEPIRMFIVTILMNKLLTNKLNSERKTN